MRKEYASLRRRPFLTPVWILALLALLGLGLAARGVLEASTTLVVVTRHAEKAADGSADPPLAPAGVERAARLAAIFGASPKGLAIDAIFVTQWQRTGATAAPLARKLGVPVIRLADDDIAGLKSRILGEYRGRRVLVIAHSDTVVPIVRALAGGGEAPPPGEVAYGDAYLIAIPRWSRPTVLGVALP
ncbi:MAG TPA: histidine phosphatase family protein [Steroidobacteraceae bacterium]|nr:histidine phosphatase family protein [Steroidobacteraceae bacterium]